MPRPKRSKIAPSAPTKIPHQRVAQPPVTASAAQKQKDLFSPPSSGRINNTSDDSDGLVVARKTRRIQTNATPQEYTMSGALAPEDVGTTRLKPPSAKTRAELMRITRETEHPGAMDGARARGAGAQEAEEADLDLIPSSIPKEPIATREDLSSSSSSSNIRRTSVHQSIQGRLGSRVQQTPRFPSSIISHSAFKKRPRQPSLLQVAQSQNQTQMDVDDDDMYHFLPDDESTPLIKSLSQPNAQPKSKNSDQAPGSRKRKQMTPEIQVPASQSQSQFTLPHSSPPCTPSHIIEQDDLHDSPAGEEGPQPSLPRHHSTQTPQTQIFSDTLAPPQSSSPAKARPKATNNKSTKALRKSKLHTNQHKRKEPSPPTSPLSSTSTQISPVRPAKSKPLTTATLQNLLPRRRVRGRPKGDYDMPSSSEIELDNTGLGEDEDELSFHATKVRMKKSGMNVPKSAAKRKDASSKKTPKTYARKSVVVSEGDENESASGKEGINENAGDGRKKTPALDLKAKAEMKRLADKFREVDEYTLDFEDMTGSSSQMKDAR